MTARRRTRYMIAIAAMPLERTVNKIPVYSMRATMSVPLRACEGAADAQAWLQRYRLQLGDVAVRTRAAVNMVRRRGCRVAP